MNIKVISCSPDGTQSESSRDVDDDWLARAENEDADDRTTFEERIAALETAVTEYDTQLARQQSLLTDQTARLTEMSARVSTINLKA